MRHLPYILMALALAAVLAGLACSPGAGQVRRSVLADWGSPGPGANRLALTFPGEPLSNDIEVREAKRSEICRLPGGVSLLQGD